MQSQGVAIHSKSNSPSADSKPLNPFIAQVQWISTPEMNKLTTISP